MKILYVLDSLGTGGAEKSTADLWYHLRAEGHSVKVIALRPRKEGIQKKILKDGFEVEILSGIRLNRQVKGIRDNIKKWRPDIVHSVLFKSNLLTRLAHHSLSFLHMESLINQVYHPQRMLEPNITAFKLFRSKMADRLTSRFGVDHWHAVTEGVKQHYLKETGYPAERIDVVYRGRSPNPYLPERSSIRKAVRQELNLPEKSVLFINIGRQDHQKGQVGLIQNFARLAKDPTFSETPLHLLILGRTGSASDSIRKTIARLGLEENVHLPGHIQDVYRYLAGADIFVLNSGYEGTAGVLIEAQASALPILTTEVEGLEEIVVFGKNALGHPVNDSTRFTQNARELLKKPLFRAAMQDKSLENFLRKFKKEIYCARMTALYQRVLTENDKY